MTTNVGKNDRIMRLLVGIVIAGVGVYFQSWWGLLAIIPLGTALWGYCPLYSVVGFSSQKKKDQSEERGDRSEAEQKEEEDSSEKEESSGEDKAEETREPENQQEKRNDNFSQGEDEKEDKE